jgi:hypothetical protein
MWSIASLSTGVGCLEVDISVEITELEQNRPKECQ